VPRRTHRRIRYHWGVGGRRHRGSEGPAYELVQTFVPHSGFESTARALDIKRLGKQRVEVIQIIRALTRPSTPRPAGARVEHLNLGALNCRDRLLGPREPRDRGHQSAQGVPVDLVRASKAVDHLRDRAARLRVPLVVRQLRLSHHQAVPVRPLLIRHERESAGLVLLCKAPTPGTHFTASDLPGQAIPASTKSGYGPRASARRCCARLPSCFREWLLHLSAGWLKEGSV